MNWHLHGAWWFLLLFALGIVGFVVVLLIPRRAAPVRPALPAFTAVAVPSRILILAPHEDDETLGCGGLIQQAVAVGAAVRVVYLTSGDHNQLAFMVYRMRPWLSPRVNRNMGEIRIHEAIEAMAFLGVPVQQLVFLGYPDHDTLDIWNRHWGTSPPLHSMLTDTTHVPYREAPGYGKPYKGESIVADIERELLDFRPTHIFVTHPIDANPDHRAHFLFLRVALLNLAGRIPEPQIFTYPIHMGPWPRPYFYRPHEWLSFPERLADERARSWILELTPDQVRRKYEAIRLYKSQMSDSGYWLTAFARRNELFTLVEPVSLMKAAAWSPHREAVASAETSDYERGEPSGYVAGVAYRNTGEGLEVKVGLRHPLEYRMGISIGAFGYRHDTPFEQMPKVCVESFMGVLVAHDQDVKIPSDEINAELSNDVGVVTIPWRVLGDPEAIFVQACGLTSGVVPRSYTAWQIFTLTRE
ncbi:MAG: PIG-L family deacetylase [Candidatus Aureabacteria bacterium]|nr:PIG-L family deacetylase [Candidatus Auribacterota bacterium]